MSESTGHDATSASPGSLVRYEAEAGGVDGSLGAAGESQLVEDAGDVIAGRVFADHELLRDLAVGQPPGDEGQHFALPRGERVIGRLFLRRELLEPVEDRPGDLRIEK